MGPPCPDEVIQREPTNPFRQKMLCLLTLHVHRGRSMHPISIRSQPRCRERRMIPTVQRFVLLLKSGSAPRRSLGRYSRGGERDHMMAARYPEMLCISGPIHGERRFCSSSSAARGRWPLRLAVEAVRDDSRGAGRPVVGRDCGRAAPPPSPGRRAVLGAFAAVFSDAARRAAVSDCPGRWRSISERRAASECAAAGWPSSERRASAACDPAAWAGRAAIGE
jgi:hypothetical protein